MFNGLELNAACVTYEPHGAVVDSFPPRGEEGPMWILGREYNCRCDHRRIKEYVQSRLWVTYRKGFSPIGGLGPTTDQGWGCMLRCGQMMLAQALICRHLGRDWKWNKEYPEEAYINVLKMFLDKKDSCYSIHQIAQMGVSEGKEVGHWYGPNTVAQVLRKLAAFDHWSNIAVHVALDNTVVKEDIRKLCRKVPSGNTSSSSQKQKSKTGTALHEPQQQNLGAHCSEYTWKPLVLFIPLRLGLNEINEVYVKRLTECFKIRQSLGVIGGKPNHAHYFIGVNTENTLFFLDPHTTQPVVDIDQWGHIADESYHCSQVSQMFISSLDPSIALGFYCHSEADFEDWCKNITKVIYEKDYSPMFEVTDNRPVHWPPFEEPGEDKSFEITEFDYPTEEDSRYESDEGFEVL